MPFALNKARAFFYSTILNTTDIIPYMSNKKTILIFGISSFVGSNLAEFLRKDFRVVGTYYGHKVDIPGILCIHCDVLQKEEVQLVLYAIKPEYCIYAVGLSSLIDCEESREMADALNTAGLFNVADNAQRYKSQVLLLSSHYVFSGEDKTYREMDIPDANTLFGKTKASAEFFLQKTSLNYLIFRCSYLYGRSQIGQQRNFFETLEYRLFSGQNMTLDTQAYCGFLDVYSLGMVIKICLSNGERNRLFQLSSTDIMNHYEFAKLYCKIFGASESLIHRGKWVIPLSDIPRGVDANDLKLRYKLEINNVESFLGINLPTIQESLLMTFKRFRGRDIKGRAVQGGSGINYI